VVVKLTLKTKATALATTLVVALLAVVGYLQHEQLGRDYLGVLREQQDALAASVADDLGGKLETHLAVLEQSATLVNGRMLADPAARQDFLVRLAGARPLFDGIAIVDLGGEVLANNPPHPGGTRINIRDREYFQRLLATGRSTISSPVQTRTGAGPAVLRAGPGRDSAGNLIAVFGGGLTLARSSMLGQLARAPVGRTGYFEVITEGLAPVYVVHPDPAKLLTAAAPIAPASGDIVTRKPIRTANWELRVVLPAAEANAPVHDARQRLIAQLVGAGLSAALLVWLGMQWLLRPLSTLHAAIKELRRSPGSELRLDTSGRDERGDLAREFEGLVHELHSRQAELAAVTDGSPLGIFRADIGGSITYANETYLNIHGLARHEAADGWLQLVRPEIRAEVWRGWQTAIGKPQGFDAVRRVTRRDGRALVVAIHCAPLISNGRLEGHVGTVSDITERNEAEKAMRVLTAIFDNTTDYVMQTDWRGNVTYMNPAVRRRLGIEAGQNVAHRNFAEFNTPETNARFAREIAPAVQRDGVWVGETVVYDGRRREVPISHMVIAHRDKTGRIDHYSGVMRDISAEVEAKRSQQRQAATLRSVMEAIPAIVAVVGADGLYRFVNGGFERWHSTTRERIVGRSLQDVLGRVEYERSEPWIKRALAGETVSFEKADPKRRDMRHLAITFVPLWAEGGVVDGFVAVAQDISQHRQEEVRLLQLSQRDALTGLLNRAGFEEFLERRLAEGCGPGMALLYIDLDHFKPVNDAHGHAVGDELLQSFAQRLRHLVRPTDAVARLGGDEFAVVLTGVRERANAQTVAEKVLVAAREPFELGELRLNIGASVGVAFGVEPNLGWRGLLARADTLLYQAKREGRGRQAGVLH
jgi:diguanylate cyclase (GGDEF)-like protein/PAS domain S-box-containing protein